MEGRGHSTIYCPKKLVLRPEGHSPNRENENKTLTLLEPREKENMGRDLSPFPGMSHGSPGTHLPPRLLHCAETGQLLPKKYEGQETTRPEPQLEPPGCPLIPRRRRRTSRSPGSPATAGSGNSLPGLGKGMDSVMAESAMNPRTSNVPEERDRRIRGG